MSTTEELLSLLEKQYKGWNRDGPRGIRHYLNIAQRMLCNVEGEQLMIVDESTGKLPSITTVAGTFVYNLPSTVNFIDSVVVESNSNTSLVDNLWQQDYGNRTHKMPAEDIVISGIVYDRVPFVRSFPADENNVAKVVFTEDPGTTSDTYRYRGYKLPTDIVSDSIALTIPPPYDMELLYPATAMLLEAVQNGNWFEAINAIRTQYVPEMHQAFNRGAYGMYNEAEDHGF